MESLDLRPRAGQIVMELVLTVVFSAILGLGTAEAVPDEYRMTVHHLTLVLLVAAVFTVAGTRWRFRARIDRDGIERRRGRALVDRLEWEEIDEIFLLGPLAFEVRGAGKSIRVPAAYDGVAQGRELCSRRLGGLRERLRQRALGRGELVFRMPASRWRVHVEYGAVLLILTGITGAMLLPFLQKTRMGFPFFLVFFGGGWLWGLRGRASRAGTRVTLFRDGILVRRLDGKDRVPWAEIAGTEWDREGGLVLLRRSGKRIPLPSRLGNISLLEEFVEEARAESRIS
ncbi:MAG TPA: hypothetical protein VE981_02335 [Planctomycetota bacterium]|nr:hypothetical protein [Planctomycetota bacterium]